MALRVGLTYTHMKLGRAYEHLDQLKREVDVFIQGKPYTITDYDDPEHARYVMRVEQHITSTRLVRLSESSHTACGPR